jgi:Prokaryotic E2 family E
MSHSESTFQITINGEPHSLQGALQSGAALKTLARLPLDHVLERVLNEGHVEALEDREFRLTSGDHFVIREKDCHAVLVLINRKPYLFADPHQTGRSLKARAGIPEGDVLFLNRPKEDEVIPDDKKVTLRTGDRFHSAPAANYGDAVVAEIDVAEFPGFEVLPQLDGWTWLKFAEFPLNDGYEPRSTTLLIKLPPSFPDAAPDMFWFYPAIRTASGAVPQGTSSVDMLGGTWQQFSWHLQPGAWIPGVSSLRDFLRCVHARLEKRN